MKKPILKIAAMALSAAIMAAPTTYAFAAENADTVLSSEDVAETVQTEDTDIMTADTRSGAYYYVTANILNVRSGPGTNYSLVGTYTQGTRVYAAAGLKSDLTGLQRTHRLSILQRYNSIQTSA